MRGAVLRGSFTEVTSLVGILLFFILATGCQQDEEWADATGARKARGVGKWFEGNWIGEPWGTITLSDVAGDSVRGGSQDGQIRIRGTVVRHRIDVEIRGEVDGTVRTGYFYLIPETDSLFVGIRAPDSSWERFFPMVRQRGSAPT